jgi:hypothetical protein
MGRSFKRGLDYPHEGFVQASIERYFATKGFELDTAGRVDLTCRHSEQGHCWHIEAKGVTTQIGLDFRTGLGQLLQAIVDEDVSYALAIPDTPAFRAQTERVSSYVRGALNLHWLFVRSDGTVMIEPPPRANPGRLLPAHAD